MRASFVIVNYNRKDEILLTISKTKDIIGAAVSDFELIVVDNASTDGSAEAIETQFPDVVLIKNPVNTGAPAWNLGFAKAKGRYFIILDDDSSVEKGLGAALDYMDERPNIGVLALKISGGAYETSHWVDLGERVGFIGCGAIIRKDLYDKIGGYAEWIFLYTNEWEYGIRTLQAGYKVIYFEKCHVKHRASTINRTSKRLIVFSVRNEMAIVHKYFSKQTRFKYVRRVLFNNLKGLGRYGLSAVGWYIEAMKEYKKLVKTLPHTPVRPEVENAYKTKFWSTQPVIKSFFFKDRTI
jgi:GT2 family glycosyltransferase